MARRIWIALGAAAVLVAPVACSSDDGGEVSAGPEQVAPDGGPGAVPAGPTAAFMSQVAEQTAEAPAFEVAMTMEAVDVEELGSGTLLSVQGSMSGDGRSGSLTFDMSGLFSMAPELGDAGPMGGLLADLAEPMEIVVDGDTTYLRGGVVAMMGGDGWISLPTEGEADPTGGLTDPSAFLDLLGQAGEVTEVGTEDIGGTATTHYQVAVDVDALVDQAGAAGELGGLPPVGATVDVWVDEAAGQVRRLQMEVDGSAVAGFGGSMVLTVDLTPLDGPVEVVVPDASEVTPMDELDGLFGGLGGLGG